MSTIYTYEDYKLWEGDWELIYGIAYAMAPAPMIKHQAISNRIARFLDEALESCKTCQALLPIDWKIDDSSSRFAVDLLITSRIISGAFVLKFIKNLIITQSTKQKYAIITQSTKQKE